VSNYNASVALAYLVSGQRIQLLVTEADLPGGICGIELARSARQVHPGLRILVVSKGMQVLSKQFDFLTKPYRPADLVNVVGAVLTSDTFSVETEQLLADARVNAASGGGFPAEPRLSDVSSEPIASGGPIRLAVMPFKTIGAGTDRAFSLGLAEEITAAFSRFRAITCVASASVGALADEPPGESDLWKTLNLDFLVQGSLRTRGREVRVILRLMDMRGSGEMSWGQRFDSPMPDLLNLQDRIAREVAAQVVPELIVWEGQEASIRPQVNPTAYHLLLRAIPAVYRLDETGFREAGALLEQALAIGPSSAGCHSWLAHWYLFLVGQGWAQDRAKAAERAEYLSQQAIILDPGDARGFTVAGHVRAFLHKDAQGALWLHDRAIALNPRLAHSYLGRHAEAIGRLQHAQQLSPDDPHGFFFDMALGVPYLLTGQYEKAASAGRKACDLNPGFSSSYKGLLAALGHLGATSEAAKVLERLMRLEPAFSIRNALEGSPLKLQEDLIRYVEGLRRAGVQE
jgi:TolB-like protein